jgi:putative ABC transport system substrate-binding protein
MMKRRTFLIGGACSLLAPALARAQQEAKSFRIGVVSSIFTRSAPQWIEFTGRLRAMGYVEGQNLTIEFRNVEGRRERFPEFMAELVRLGVDVLVAPGSEAALQAAQAATKTIPIVTVAIDYDPVARGYVASLARPGGNTTGVFLQQVELTAKRIQLLKETLPNLEHAAVFWDTFSADQLEAADVAARGVGLQLQHFKFQDPPYQFDAPIRAIVRQRSNALLLLASPVFLGQGPELAEIAIRNRLPTSSPFGQSAKDGVLMAYGANLPQMFGLAAEYVGKILRGVKPSDLPMQQPTQFELVVNLKTAQALGIKIPDAVLLRADEVIR